jgi:hypothetical protein
MKYFKSFNQAHYTFFKMIVEEKCPKCGATKLMHYSWCALTDSSGHFRACLNEECDFNEFLGPLEEACKSCDFPGEEIPCGLFQVNLCLPKSVKQAKNSS